MKTLHDKITDFRLLFTEIVDEVEQIEQNKLDEYLITPYSNMAMDEYLFKLPDKSIKCHFDKISKALNELSFYSKILIEKL